MNIRKATKKDLKRVLDMFQEVINQKIYYPYDHNTSQNEIEHSWVNLNNHIYVAEEENELLGAYIVKPNYAGWGQHIANAAYMVDSRARGKGIGRQLTKHSLQSAKEAGFRAMQFNLVVSTNKNAVHLWKEHGFEIIATIPEGFLHHELGYVDAYIFYRKL